MSNVKLLVLNSNTWNSLTVSLNWIIDITNIWNSLTVCKIEKIEIMYQYLEPFNCVQMNESCWIELLALNSNTCKTLTVFKQSLIVNRIMC